MGLPQFVRSILSPNRFPRIKGQELPHPVETGPKPVTEQQEDRLKTLNFKASQKPDPTPALNEP